MTRARWIALVLVSLGVTAALSVNRMTLKRTVVNTPAATLEDVSALLGGARDLKLKAIDCTFMYQRDVSDHARCFASPINLEALPALLSRSLNTVGVTSGWRDDYATPGAFYAMKANPQQVIGVIVNAIADLDDSAITSKFRGYKSFVALSVDLHPRQH